MKFFSGILAFLFVLLGMITLRPDLVWASDSWALATPFAQLIALRAVLALVFFGVAVFFLVFALIRRRLFEGGAIAFTVAAAYLAMSIFHGATLYSRGIAVPERLGPDIGITEHGVGNGDITLLSYNTQGGAISSEDVVAAVAENGVDVLVLTETGSKRAAELNAMLAERGLSFQQFDTGTDRYQPEFASTALLISTALGEYEQRDENDFPAATVVAEPLGAGPTIIGVHPFAPVPRAVSRWRSDITEIYELCSWERPLIMAGDFNSTVDHQLILGAECHDARISAGSGGLGSWPTNLPALLGAPIDRVLTNGAYVGVDSTLIQTGESDHRGVIVRLRGAS